MAEASVRTWTADWLFLNWLAFTATLFYLFIDVQIGLFGDASTTIAIPQAGALLFNAVVMGVWAYALGLSGRGSKLGSRVVFALALVWGALVNGLIAFVAAPPPSAGFPYQDIAHTLALIFGGAAAYTTWTRLRGPQSDLV